MATKDKLVYFDVYGRAEPIRMLYAFADKELEDVRISMEEWPALKAEQPLGQLPVLTTEEGTLCESDTIARYVAKKFGLVGEGLWEETLHDLVVEACEDIIKDVPSIYGWKVAKRAPEPEDSEKIVADVKEGLVQKLPYIQSIAERRGKKFIVSDSIGLADIWFYSMIDFLQAVYPDSKELTTWINEFVSKMEADERINKYITNRPESKIM